MRPLRAVKSFQPLFVADIPPTLVESKQESKNSYFLIAPRQCYRRFFSKNLPFFPFLRHSFGISRSHLPFPAVFSVGFAWFLLPPIWCLLFSCSFFRTHAYVLSHFSHVRLFAIPWTVASLAPLSMDFSRQEYWNGLPFSSPGDIPNPGIEPGSPALRADSLPTEPLGKLVGMERKRHSLYCNLECKINGVYHFMV